MAETVVLSPQSQYVPVDLNPAATEDAARNLPNPFIDDKFAPLDTRNSPDFSRELGEIAEEHPELMGQPPAPTAETDPEITAPAAPAVHEPEVIQYDDGTSITIEKTNKGWCASLDSGAGGLEKFFGKTKDEMWTNLAAGKVAATRHIRDLNKRLKLGTGPVATDAPAQPATTAVQSKILTADEIFEIKNLLSSDPNLALEKWFQKKTGFSVEQLTALARNGESARQELEAESVVRDFRANHPEYDATPGTGNFDSMISWLMKYKLNQPLNGRDPNTVMPLLYEKGAWTVQNLEEAFEDLADAGLLQLLPEEEEPPVALEAPAPAPQPQPTPNPRIAAVRVGPRAGLGIRTRETTQAAPATATRPLSADEFDNMSDAEIAKHFNDVRRYVAQSARR